MEWRSSEAPNELYRLGTWCKRDDLERLSGLLAIRRLVRRKRYVDNVFLAGSQNSL